CTLATASYTLSLHDALPISCRFGSGLARPHRLVAPLHFVGPGRMDVGEHGADLAVGERGTEGRHVTLVARRRMLLDTVLDDVEHLPGWMVPCVSARVVRRRRHASRR